VTGPSDRVDAGDQRPGAGAAVVLAGRERADDRVDAGGDEVDDLSALFLRRVGELGVVRDGVRAREHSCLHDPSLTTLSWLGQSFLNVVKLSRWDGG
jgi:hypothetical protein